MLRPHTVNRRLRAGRALRGRRAQVPALRRQAQSEVRDGLPAGAGGDEAEGRGGADDATLPFGQLLLVLVQDQRVSAHVGQLEAPRRAGIRRELEVGARDEGEILRLLPEDALEEADLVLPSDDQRRVSGHAEVRGLGAPRKNGKELE